MAAVDTDRVQALENQIRQLQAVHAQLVSYAEDLNRTYHELRHRLQQMTALSNVAMRLAGARTVESASRICADATPQLFPNAHGRVYLESRGSSLKVAYSHGEEIGEGLHGIWDDLARAAVTSDTAERRSEPFGERMVQFIAVRLTARGRTFGALVIARSDSPFNRDDAHVVELLGHNTAAAISNIRLFEHTRRLAMTDPVTKLYNARHFSLSLNQEVQKAKRLRYPIAVIMADIDHFKKFNDTYGHLNGNVALRRVAQAITRSLRQTDTVARYGGEEFAAILPGCDRLSLVHVAEKVRTSVARTPIRVASKAPPVHLTISVGGAWQDADHVEAESLLSKADAALYAAKEMGRDRALVDP